MLAPDIHRRVRHIEWHTRRLVQNIFAGAYQSVYKGRGLAFSAVRPYIPGDEVRNMDWKVTARTGEPHVRQHIEERELTVLLVVDASASVIFGTQDQQKRDVAAEIGAILAYAANYNQDRAGLLVFSDHIEHYIPPRKGRQHIMHLVRDLLTFEPLGKGTDLAVALRLVNRVSRSGTIIFLLSDFLAPAEAYERDLRILSQRHDVCAIVLSDALEETMPEVGLIALQDSETDAVRWVDTTSRTWQRQFYVQQKQQRQGRDALLQRSQIGQIRIPPHGDHVAALTAHFRQEAQLRR